MLNRGLCSLVFSGRIGSMVTGSKQIDTALKRKMGAAAVLAVVLFAMFLTLHSAPNDAKSVLRSELETDEDRDAAKASETADVLRLALEVIDAPEFMKNMDEPRQKFDFIIEPSILEEASSDTARWTSVVLVKSAQENVDRRNAIRETWADLVTYDGSTFFTVFVVGLKPSDEGKEPDSVVEEHNANGDILLVDILDTDEHIPEKTLASMQWAADSLPGDWIFSSATDDMALHVPNFARYIDNSISETLVKVQSAPSTRHLPIMCVYSYKERDPPARRPTSEWYMSKLRYSPEYWPPYCRGGWYSMPVELAGKLFRISRRMEYLILDDVWITGLMRIKYLAGVRLMGNHIAAEAILRLALHAAPLALRTDWELGKNMNESAAQVIVSHAWGNVENREVNVPQMLRNNWEKWSCSFPEEKVDSLM